MKISTSIIAIIIISLGGLMYGLFYADIAINYGKTYDNGTLDKFNKFAEVNTLTASINTTANNGEQSTSSGFNILGDFLASGYKTIKTAASVTSIYTDIINSGIDNIVGLSQAAQWFKQAIYGILFVVITFFIISVLVNREV